MVQTAVSTAANSKRYWTSMAANCRISMIKQNHEKSFSLKGCIYQSAAAFDSINDGDSG